MGDTKQKIWTCKIGEVDADRLPEAADWPMRKAVAEAYRRITGQPDDFIFSGWGGELTESERAVVEDRLPQTTPCPGLNEIEPERPAVHCPGCAGHTKGGDAPRQSEPTPSATASELAEATRSAGAAGAVGSSPLSAEQQRLLGWIREGQKDGATPTRYQCAGLLDIIDTLQAALAKAERLRDEWKATAIKWNNEHVAAEDRLMRERDEAHAQRQVFEDKLNETLERLRERDADVARLRKALEEISSKLDCDPPCTLSQIATQCKSCGHIVYEVWCAGCVARAALASRLEVPEK